VSNKKAPHITIFDYGVGNLHSIKKALELGGAIVTVSKSIDTVFNAKAIVFPGVGDFGAVMKAMGPLAPLISKKLAEGTPALGICIGFQIMFGSSEEAPIKGLDFMKGDVVKFKGVRVPHMGWNNVKVTSAGSKDPIMKGVPNNGFFYFANSYAPRVSGRDAIALGEAKYGRKFPALMRKANTYGTQFHPEKSGKDGLRLIKNFVGFVAKEADK
jgi:glutamine amidotransferase